METMQPSATQASPETSLTHWTLGVVCPLLWTHLRTTCGRQNKHRLNQICVNTSKTKILGHCLQICVNTSKTEVLGHCLQNHIKWVRKSMQYTKTKVCYVYFICHVNDEFHSAPGTVQEWSHLYKEQKACWRTKYDRWIFLTIKMHSLQMSDATHDITSTWSYRCVTLVRERKHDIIHTT